MRTKQPRSSRSRFPGISLYKHHNGGWIADFRDPETGRRIRRLLSAEGFTTLAEAHPWLVQKSQELQKQKLGMTGRTPRRGLTAPWRTITQEYQEAFGTEHSEKSVKATFENHLAPWREFVSGRVTNGGDLTPQHLAAFRTWLAQRRKRIPTAGTGRGETFKTLNHGSKPAALNRRLAAAKAFLNWARRAGYIRLNRDDIEDQLRLFKLDKPAPVVLSKQQIKALLRAVVEYDTQRYVASRANKSNYGKTSQQTTGEAIHAPLGAYLILSLLTGARPGEVTALRWDGVDLDRLELLIIAGKTGRRVIPLHDSLLLQEVLIALKLRAGSAVHIIGDAANAKPRTIQRRAWRRLLDMAGLDYVPPKATRSTTIAHIVSASPDPEYLLQARFGHTIGVSKRNYRRPLHGLSTRGTTVEQWLGCEQELRMTCEKLGFLSPTSARATESA